jgi:large subunit ribosomal protein L30
MAVKQAKATTQVKKAKEPVEKQLRIRLVRSVIGRPKKHREVVKGLGLRRIDSQVVRRDCPEIRGMINLIPHLLKVEELD